MNQTYENILQETERQSGNTGRLNRNLYVLLKLTERPKTPRIPFKYMPFSEGNQLFAGKFRGDLEKANFDMVEFTKSWNWK